MIGRPWNSYWWGQWWIIIIFWCNFPPLGLIEPKWTCNDTVKKTMWSTIKKNIKKIKKEEVVQFIWVPRKKVQLFFFFFENQSTINLVELFRKPKICKTNVYQSTTLFYFISEKQPIFFYWFVIKCLPNFMYFTVNIVIPTCKSRITNVNIQKM